MNKIIETAKINFDLIAELALCVSLFVFIGHTVAQIA